MNPDSWETRLCCGCASVSLSLSTPRLSPVSVPSSLLLLPLSTLLFLSCPDPSWQRGSLLLLPAQAPSGRWEAAQTGPTTATLHARGSSPAYSTGLWHVCLQRESSPGASAGHQTWFTAAQPHDLHHHLHHRGGEDPEPAETPMLSSLPPQDFCGVADLTSIVQMWKLRLTKVKSLATVTKQRWAWKTVAPPHSQHP